MLYATNRFPGDGMTTQYEISFVGGYLDRAHVKAYVEGADLVQTPVTLSPGNFLGPYTIGGLQPVPVGSTIVIYRDTPKAPIVDFVNGSRLTESNLDTATRQGSFIAAEGADASLGNVSESADRAEAAAQIATGARAAAVTAKDQAVAASTDAATSAAEATVAAQWGLKYFDSFAEATTRALLLQDGTDVEVSQDETRAGARTRYKVQAGALVFVVNLDQIKLDLAAATGASLVGFQQEGTGAVPTTVQDKLREVVSVKDFGAVGDGVTDDTNAINAAIAANPGKVILFPSGNYLVSSTIVLPFVDYGVDYFNQSKKAVTLSGEPTGRQIFNTARIFGNVAGPIIKAVGVYNGPTSIDFTATIGHGVENLIVENTNTSVTTSIGIQFGYIYCPHLKNVEVSAKAICVDLGKWTMVGNFDNVSTGGSNFGLKASACWASVWKHGRSFYNKCAMFIDASDFRVTDFNAEHNKIVYDFIGSTVIVENSHIEDFDCLYTNDKDPIAQVTAGYVNAGSTANGDFPSLVSFNGGFYLAWTQAAPYFVERPTTLGALNTLEFKNAQVDAVSSPNQITVASAFNSKAPTNQGRFIFENNYPPSSFLFRATAKGDRQEQYYSARHEQVGPGAVVNHYISKLRVGSLATNIGGGFYPANRTIPANSTASWTRTVLGARTSDFVMYQHGADNANLVIRAFVSSNDTVTVVASNNTSSAQSLGDNSESIMVFQAGDGLFSNI